MCAVGVWLPIHNVGSNRRIGVVCGGVRREGGLSIKRAKQARKDLGDGFKGRGLRQGGWWWEFWGGMSLVRAKRVRKGFGAGMGERGGGGQ